MNPLCCIAPVSLERGDRGNPSPVVELKSAKPALGAESPTRNSSSKRLIQAPAIPPDSDAAAACHEAAEESAAVAEGGDGRGVNGAVAGILWKWVNFGKGWRSRWFVLQDGVLSYYKVHGPDRILMGPVASEAGVRVIGEESLRRVRKEQQWGNVGFARQGATKQWKPFGEVHLKVSNEFEPMVEVTVSTEKLRGRLLLEQLSEATVREYFYSVISEGTATDSEADNESQGADVETDEDDGMYFDTRDFLSSESLRSGSYRSREHLRNDVAGSTFGIESSFPDSMQDIGLGVRTLEYPYVKRRNKLPEPKEKEKPVGLWSIIKENIGKDLSGVCLPVYFNEPLSSLQKCFEDLEYSYLVDRALEWGRQGNSLMRILHVAAFAVSGYASTEGRQCKPFNPLLGETYEADFPDKGLRFFSEKVHGFVQDNRTGNKVAMLMGKWDEAIYYVLGDPSTKPKGYDPMSEAVLLWERDKSVTQTRYNLTPFAISLNELAPSLMEKLPPTDSRLRPDQRHLENGEYELANLEKLRLEQLQRQVFPFFLSAFAPASQI
ncbi:hypothetical protein BHE74_00002861 [Ensete ventricosum]|nr:hypothetical protein BHE74_00002861 [Ensete ventricosum]